MRRPYGNRDTGRSRKRRRSGPGGTGPPYFDVPEDAETNRAVFATVDHRATALVDNRPQRIELVDATGKR